MRAAFAFLLLAVATASLSPAAPALAQGDPFGAGMGGDQPPPKGKKDDEYVRPKEALEPLPEPLTADEEKARERAKERGVLLSDNPKPGFISELRIEGAKKIEPDAILVQVQTRIDKKPDRRVIQADIRRIWQMEIFQDVVVEAREGKNDSVVIVFRLTEKPAIDEVLVEGNREISREDVLEVVDIKAFQVLDEARVRTNTAKIQKLYVDKGFFLAEVTAEVKPSTGTSKPQESGLLDMFARDRNVTGDDGAPGPAPRDKELEQKDKEKPRPDKQAEGEFVDIVFHVKEAAKVRIERITFVGNDHVASDDLAMVLRTHEAHPLGVLNEWGVYKEEQVDIDQLAIEAVYQDKGYINVKVGKPRTQLTPDKTRIALEYPIVEGKQYKLRSFSVTGDLIVDKPEDGAGKEIFFLRDDLVSRTRVRAGDIFSRTAVAIDVNAVADRYRDKGYAYVNIEPGTLVHDEDDSIDLALTVSSGPRVTVERIDITGNNKTQDSVVRRELRIYEGEFYSATQLRLSEQRVNALGFFEKVNITTKPGTQPDRMVLVIDVKEKSTGTFQVGAGFSNAESILFTGQVSYNNFLGLGTTVSGSVQWSSFRRIFDFRFIDPYAFYIGQDAVTLGLSAFNTSRFFLDFERDSTGGDLTVGYPIGRPLSPLTRPLLEDAPAFWRPYIPDFENLQLFMTASLERVVIDDSSFNVRLLGLQTNLPRWTTSLRTSVMFDQRNNRLFPSAGWFWQGSLEYASPYFGSALMPGAEAAVKDGLVGAGLKNGLGFMYHNGRANHFARATSTARGYLNFDQWLPVSGVVLKANTEYGLIVSQDDLTFENYYMGGFNTIRGYYLRSVSPVARVGPTGDPSAPLVEFRTGGNQQLFGNLELEFPVLEQVGIRGVLFFDAGNVYGKGELPLYADTWFDPQKRSALENRYCAVQEDPQASCWSPTQLPLGLYYSVGFGVRWFSPIGPLRFELGFPLTPRPVGTFGFRQGDQPYSFEFNVGNSF